MDCINCQEHKSLQIIDGIGICRDPECIFIHNTLQPTICACCGNTLSSHITHEFCQSAQIRARTRYRRPKTPRACQSRSAAISTT